MQKLDQRREISERKRVIIGTGEFCSSLCKDYSPSKSLISYDEKAGKQYIFLNSTMRPQKGSRQKSLAALSGSKRLGSGKYRFGVVNGIS